MYKVYCSICSDDDLWCFFSSWNRPYAEEKTYLLTNLKNNAWFERNSNYLVVIFRLLLFLMVSMYSCFSEISGKKLVVFPFASFMLEPQDILNIMYFLQDSCKSDPSFQNLVSCFPGKNLFAFPFASFMFECQEILNIMYFLQDSC